MRFVQLFLIALFMVVSMVGPASAQATSDFEPVVVQNEAGWKAAGEVANQQTRTASGLVQQR